ncbi:hypothetical protein [Amycolatopsis roodepoortensis]|uniref:hypothetical protein n=1 Tax=Amycolatopsis roodepoortensis TaxID=700274 RepID=UPI0035305A55
MHAIRQYKPGKPVYERVPAPSPGRGQVRIAVKACVVDRGDAAIPGQAVAGVVDKLGEGLGPLLAQSAHNVRATVALTDGATIVGGPVTAVLDGVGGKAGRAAFDLLAPGARMVHQQGKGWAGGDGRAPVGAVATGFPEFDDRGGEKAVDDKRPDRGGHRVGAEAKGELASVDVGGVGHTEGDQAGAAALNPEGAVSADAGHDPAPRRRRLILSGAESRSSEG